DELTAAVGRALAIGATTADAVRVLLEVTREAPVALFRLDGRPHLAGVTVPRPDLAAYHVLRAGGGPWSRLRRPAPCCSSTTSRRCGCRPSWPSARRWPSGAPPTTPTTWPSCSNSPSWSCSTGSGGQPSGG